MPRRNQHPSTAPPATAPSGTDPAPQLVTVQTATGTVTCRAEDAWMWDERRWAPIR